MKSYERGIERKNDEQPTQSNAIGIYVSNQAMSNQAIMSMLKASNGNTRFSELLRAKYEAKNPTQMGLSQPMALSSDIMQKVEERDQTSDLDTEFKNILELAANGDKISLSEEMESFIADKSFHEIKLLLGKLPNRAVRKWYLSHDAAIKTEIDLTGSLEQQAQQAFDLRNLYRTQARDLMDDQIARAELDKTDPNKTFEELVADKMRRKGLTREEALEDIISTAGKTRKTINRALGLE